MSTTPLYVEVLLPVFVEGTFTYEVPPALQDKVQEGIRVLVEFGRRKIHTGIIWSITDEVPAYNAKPLEEILDDTPVVDHTQMRFWEWISQYYMCTLGEVMSAALPAGLKLSSQSNLQLNPERPVEEIIASTKLSKKALLLLHILKEKEHLPYDEVTDLLELSSPYRVIKELSDCGAIFLYETVKEKYQPKIRKRVRINPILLEEDGKAFVQLMDEMKAQKAKRKQYETLEHLLSLLPLDEDPTLNETGVIKKELVDSLPPALSASSLNTLIKNKILEEVEEVLSRLDDDTLSYQNIEGAHPLSEAQQQVESEIIDHFEEKDIVLLHGVTGSGKTEVYISLIQKVIDSGGQVLFLLPEIVLTAQMVSRLKKVFGNQLGVYHSRYSDRERVEIWKGVMEDRFQVIVGVRSSIFLPFSNLALVVVDEEHEVSFKQVDPAPHYNAKDAAMVLAKMHHARVVLGSATPSIETYYQAVKGNYGFCTLSKRHGQAQLPDIILVNQAEERKAKTMQQSLTSVMLEEITQRIQNQEQVIIFQNRRGYAPYILCHDCGWIPHCPHCAVSLTYHLYRNELKCHYCGHQEAVPKICVHCGSTAVETIGTGTQRLEEDLKELVENARVQRLDQDTSRNKYSYQRIIKDFEDQHIDILVGTQMVAKGLDFEHVSLVGVFDIDRIINFPDFRALERTYQILTQVSGRAGRKHLKGLVLIQTENTKQPIFTKVLRNDYQAFYREEIQDRERFFYPPFSRMIKVTIKAKEKQHSESVARLLHQSLVYKLGKQRVIGPQAPLINKIRNQYLTDIIIKFERNHSSPKKVKAVLRQSLEELKKNQLFRKTRIYIDVDPV
ncbi:replication restart helicase PriA [Algivirga pacifica]|uniref:Replication restart protein PriA n=1 Tax=Algivirga pacifica TaxID=1162670 RepID=A0ABP9CYH7_9BACT